MKTIIQTPITREVIDQAFSYSEFNAYTEKLFTKGKTTNEDNTESMLNYTKLNISRTNRIDKKGELNSEMISTLQNLVQPQIWLTLTEGWCGDSAQLLPYINLMAEQSNNVELRVILRDEHPEIMDQFLTNGVSRSIPKVIILDAKSLEPLGEWGPRPSDVQDKYLAEKADPEIGGKQASQNLHSFYAKNKGAILQDEFIELLNSI
ncbi:MAG: thioredoxin family protein [Balneolales bacterium]|nr:thioredoxin family protein [Balneolales bacterium]